jgi:hypothetical protein
VSCVAFAGAISSKMAANFVIACILSVPGCLNGMVGVGCCRAWARSNDAIVASFALEMTGILQCWGGDSSVLLILSCPVVEQYTWCAL